MTGVPLRIAESVEWQLRSSQSTSRIRIRYASSGSVSGAGWTSTTTERFWPGNAIAIRAVNALPVDEWTQVAVSYDGSGDAGGMKLFVDARPVPSVIVRNHLYKSPQNSGSGLSFGARFRSPGLKDGLLDELRVYNRPLASLEMEQLFDGHSLQDALDGGLLLLFVGRASAFDSNHETVGASPELTSQDNREGRGHVRKRPTAA